MEEETTTMVQREFPDFSDIYDESFWDFMSHREISKDEHETSDEEFILPSASHTFWDFLSSRTENVKYSPKESCQFGDFFSSSDDKVEERLLGSQYTHCSNIQGNCYDTKIQKSSTSDEFWDFLNSSTENVNNSATAPCSTAAEKHQQLDWPSKPHTDTDSDKQNILPRISSVFSISNNTVSNVGTPEYIINNSTVATNLSAACSHPIKVTKEPKVESDTKTLKDPDKFSTIRDSLPKKHSKSCSTLVTVSGKNASLSICETQNIELKAENISCTIENTSRASNEVPAMVQNACLNNNGTGPFYVLLPSAAEIQQKPNYSQYLIVISNAAPLRPESTSNNEALNRSDAIDTCKSSALQNCPSVDYSRGFERDLDLKDLRNNHVLNKRKKSLESPFVTPKDSGSKCFQSAPLDNSISALVKCESTETANKQIRRTSVRHKPIKCISLGKCKNAIQQTNTPISLDAFETNVELKSCSAAISKTHSFASSDDVLSYETPFQLKDSCQVNSFLTQIPISNQEQSTSASTKQSIAPPSYQTTEVYDPLQLPGCLLVSARASPPPHATKVLILQEARPNKIIFPKPPLRYEKVMPKKCRRKTVKELLQEHHQQFKHACKGSEVTTSSLKQIPTPESSKHVPDTDSDGRPSILVVPSTTNCSSATKGTTHCISPHEKSFRPRHYDMSELQIGFFKVQEDACRGRYRSKFKVLFMKRQFQYDFPVRRCNQPSLRGMSTGDDEMVRIAILFRTITSISLKDRMIHLNVDSPPHLPLLTQSGFAEVERWGHFLKTSFTHKIVLRKRQASKLKSILCQFDDRFISLTNIINPLSPSMKPLGRNRKCVARRVPEWEEGLLLNQMCSCRTNCRSIRCSCVKAARSCSSRACQCTNCNNPLNVLEMVGLDIDISLQDTCLFQNIYQIPDLTNYLLREVRLDCCNCLARVQDCIPGIVFCPNINCNASLQYSWCQKMVSYPERNPRNHCSLCGHCCFANGRHCQACKKCYAITSKSNKCPTCLSGPPSLTTFCHDRSRSSSKAHIILLDSSRNKPKLPEEEKNEVASQFHLYGL